jgi:hypothetical protein
MFRVAGRWSDLNEVELVNEVWRLNGSSEVVLLNESRRGALMVIVGV